MQANYDQTRQSLLQKERKIEVCSNGIPVLFHKGALMQFPYAEMDWQYVAVLQEWLSSKFSINIYSANGWSQVGAIDKGNVYLFDNKLIFQLRIVENILLDQAWYILARNNATIELLKSALDNSHKVEVEIYEFLNNPAVTEISSNKLFELEEWAYHGLNQSQKRAVELVTNEKIAFIKGPPGCGKTKTIARLATIFSYWGYRMLIGAVSNTANMTILNAILKQSQEMNYMPNVVLFISKQSYADNIKHPPYVRSLTFRYKVVESYLMIDQNRNATWDQVENLLEGFWNGDRMSKMFITIYYQAVAKVFHQAHIVIITTTSATKLDYRLDEDQKFKPFIGVLDEASQASWADAYCFLNKSVHKMVFIGDDKQLTPTVISQNEVLKQCMFTLYKKTPKYYVLLNEQYRMHPAISQFPNAYFYNNELQNGVTATERQSHVPYFKKYPVSFINNETEEYEQIEIKSGKRNYFNIGEIEIIGRILAMFKKEQMSTIGIISPYDLQIKNIKAMFQEQIMNYGLTVRTCDGYQGSEKEYIIVSCVRSNKEGKIGFCSEENRLNVTITRARRGVVLIGNKNTFLSETQQANVWHKYLQYLGSKKLIIEQEQLQSFFIEPEAEKSAWNNSGEETH